eukprot:gene9983-6967_t
MGTRTHTHKAMSYTVNQTIYGLYLENERAECRENEAEAEDGFGFCSSAPDFLRVPDSRHWVNGGKKVLLRLLNVCDQMGIPVRLAKSAGCANRRGAPLLAYKSRCVVNQCQMHNLTLPAVSISTKRTG